MVSKDFAIEKPFQNQFVQNNFDKFRSSQKSKRVQNIKSLNMSLSPTNSHIPKAVKNNNTTVVTPLNKKPDNNLKTVMIDDIVVANQKNKENSKMKRNLDKHIDYVLKSKPRKTI